MTTTTIRAIDTRYKGHRFRSRTEARWAVFFDQLGIEWQYEVEGFELPDGTRYLPDFLITTPQGSTRWVEIKPLHVGSDSKFDAFCRAMADADQGLPLLVNGTPWEWINYNDGMSFCPRCGAPVEGGHGEYWCYSCDYETPCGGGHPIKSDGVKGARYQPHKGVILQIKRADSDRWQRLIESAAERAQMARFEHGENG